MGQGRIGMGRQMVGVDVEVDVVVWVDVVVAVVLVQTVLFFWVRSSSVRKMTTQIGSSGTIASNDEDKSKLSEKDKNSCYLA